MRIGRRAIVSFPNFGHWRVRWHLLSHGRMPVTEPCPTSWYDTPNIHLCTILDFIELAQELDVQVERALAIYGQGKPSDIRSLWHANLFGEQGLFLLRRR